MGGWLNSPLLILLDTLFLDKNNRIASAVPLIKLFIFLTLDRAT